ncbi:MAG: 16S rRNA (guanine(527)-N(7))-methyltransferase RsmG [Hyphomicrobium sp.]
MGLGDIDHIVGPDAFKRAFAVSRETLDKLGTYAELLKRWQKTINLVAPSTLDDVWHRHFADSAQLLRHAPEKSKTWLDLGSGAGFPGLVLAILNADAGTSRHILVESDSRKAAFLREVARATATPVDILCTRIESMETQTKVKSASCVTARALAPMPRLAGLAAPYFALGTTGLFLKGREVAAELEEAGRAWDLICDLRPSLTEPEGRVVVLSALRKKEG